MVSRKAKMDLGLAKNLVLAGNEFGGYMTVMGKTISTDDFYEVSCPCIVIKNNWTVVLM